MTQLTTIDTNNFAAMAKAMGIADVGTTQKKQSSTLARLRISHSPIMGEAEVNGKRVNMEVVSGGAYRVEIPDGPTYYATSVELRPYIQRYMYKKFLKGSGDAPNRYVKTVMADNLNIDLKDNDGGFNCGKPAGYIADWKSLPEKTQELIRQIKRVRVVLGTLNLIGAVDASGNEVEAPRDIPFIWEIENRDAFKTVGTLFTKLAKQKRMPIQHTMVANTEERKLPNGNSFYLPVVSIDMTKSLDITGEEQDSFADFMTWIENYNDYIINAYSEKSSRHNDEDDELIVDGVVDIELDEEVA
ncbi:hypothetical protein N9446_00025 [bacterium]|jgi:hypothetical protein|nr:hypothetical protein [bacterium]